MLEVVIDQEGEVTRVSPVGPVDSATIEVFKDKLEPICNKSGAKVLLDCKELTYLNSRAIGLLMRFHRALMVARGRFVLCNLNPKLVRTLDLLQIGQALSIYPSSGEALAALR
jgi:anti-anti-sigma factor